jgi:hypothetical protein
MAGGSAGARRTTAEGVVQATLDDARAFGTRARCIGAEAPRVGAYVVGACGSRVYQVQSQSGDDLVAHHSCYHSPYPNSVVGYLLEGRPRVCLGRGGRDKAADNEEQTNHWLALHSCSFCSCS